jgi:hypothetical protein
LRTSQRAAFLRILENIFYENSGTRCRSGQGGGFMFVAKHALRCALSARQHTWKTPNIAHVMVAAVVATSSLVGAIQPATAQFTQQGAKLVGSGAISTSNGAAQGTSVAISADGNTVLVGGEGDDASSGAAWVFTRTNGVWSQQGSKLVGTGAIGAAEQGYSVAISSDGNTALVGGPDDNGNAGAAWVFTRSNGTWSQQGSKLVGTGAVGNAFQGWSVALSDDGNTAVVGGPGDGGGGAAWIFTRSGGVWSQQGSKLVGTGAAGGADQGRSVALSGDGNTAILGGPYDNLTCSPCTSTGAAWVFTRSAAVWSQQGSKLVGTNSVGGAQQGWSVALSEDGNTAAVGGNLDGNGIGAAWVFIRSGGVWSQQGSKLVGSGIGGNYPQEGYSVALSENGNAAVLGGPSDTNPAGEGAVWVFSRSSGIWSQDGNKLVGNGQGEVAELGTAVALSGDGNTIIAGGPVDNSNVGAAWLFNRTVPTNTHDFNDDGMSDVLWRDTSGDVALWEMNSAQLLSSAGVGAAPSVWSIVGQRDFNGDGEADILWHDTSGNVAMWFMNGASVVGSAGVGNADPSVWSIAGTGDFNGDGKGDVLWRDTSGNVALWLMNGSSVAQSCGVGNAPSNWTIAGTGDFNGDGNADILWHDNAGNVAIWFMNGCSVIQSSGLGNASPSVWSIVGTGDFNGDGKADILWHDTSGNVAIWEMNGAALLQSAGVGNANPGLWSIAETGDFNGDGDSDILWHDTSGDVAVWEMNGAAISQSAGIGNASASVWTIQGLNAD